LVITNRLPWAYVAGGWDPEEKLSFGTHNPTLLVGARRSWGGGILDKGGSRMKGMSWVG